jgi:outer membrane protein TolC
MKINAVFTILLLGLTYSTASAETDWVRRFLDRYPPFPLQAQAVSRTPASLGAMAQAGAVSLTTGDTVRLLLENNRDVVVSRLYPISSMYTVTALTQPFEPNFHVIAAANRVNSPSRSLLAGAASLVQLTNDYRAGVDQRLQTGTIYNVDFSLVRLSSNSTFNIYNPSYDALITYSFTQHLLRDFGRQVNTSQIRIARNNEKISRLQFELQVIDLITRALQSYWNLAFAGEDVKVKRRSLDLASKTLQDNQIQVEVGTLAQIDLVQAQADVAARNEALVTAQYNADLLQDQLKKLISNDTDPGSVLTRLNLIEPLREPGSEKLLPLEQAIQFALENRPELRVAGYEVGNEEINVQYTKNQMRPILDVSGGYRHVGLGGTQILSTGEGAERVVVQVTPGGVGDAFRQLFAFDFPGYNAEFALQIPIRNRGARANYERAITDHQMSTKRKEAIAQQIALDVRNAYTQVEMNRARVTTARTTRDLARQKLDAEQKKFELGTSTVRFVLEEQRNLAQAETDEIQALVNFTKALVNYDRAIGNTLERNNVELDKQLPQQASSRD